MKAAAVGCPDLGAWAQRADFDSKTANGAVHLAIDCYMELIVAAALIRTLENEAPQLTVQVTPFDGNLRTSSKTRNLDRFDMAIGMIKNIPVQFGRKLLLQDRRVCVVSKDHPLSTQDLISWDDLSRMSWASFESKQAKGSSLDRILKPLQRRMRFSVYVCGIGLVPGIVAAISHAAMMPAFAAEQYVKKYGLTILEIPYVQQTMRFSMVWIDCGEKLELQNWVQKNLIGVMKDQTACGKNLRLLKKQN